MFNKKQEIQFFGTNSGNANSIAVGYATETNNFGEVAAGILNKSTRGSNPNSAEGVTSDPKATLFSVGNGDKNGRKNALEVKGDGSVIISDTKGGTINATEQIVGINELEEKVDDLDKEIGGIINDLSKLGSKQGVVELEIGDSTEVKTKNLEKLKGVQTNDHTFFTDINYGYGTGSWLPATGGTAFIITSGGNAVTYNIAVDGSVIKGADIDLANISTELFEIVSQLPTENIKRGKIYCVKDSTSTDPENIYLEWVYLETGWEQIGQFVAEPDLSGYAKLNAENTFTSNNIFNKSIEVKDGVVASGLQIGAIAANTSGKYLNALEANDVSDSKVYATDGSLYDVGAALSNEKTLRETADNEIKSALDDKANLSDVMLVNVDDKGTQSASLVDDNPDHKQYIHFFQNSVPLSIEDEHGQVCVGNQYVEIITNDNDSGSDGFFVQYNEKDDNKMGSLTPYGVICTGLPQKDTEVLTTNGRSVDLTTYALKAAIPTKTSQLTNDSGYLTQHQSLADYAKKTDIPTKVSQLTNDSGYVTKEELLTDIDLSSYAKKTDLDAVKSDVEQVKQDVQYITQQDTILDQVSYGIEWDASTSSSDCIRIGNLSMHKSLPIQSQMKGVIHQHGVIQYYLDPNDWSKKADGTPSRLDGYDGEIGVTMPKFYLWSETEGTKRRVRISEIKAVPYAQEMPAHILGAKRAVRLNKVPENMGYLSTLPVNSLVSICNTSDYCTGSRSSASDSMKDTYIERTRFGKPITGINRATARAQARLAGNQLQMYDQYKALFWLYYIEYANLNCQTAFNAEPTSEGYKQGGLGNGVTNINYDIWVMFNGQFPIFSNDIMNEYGNFTASKNVTLPAFTTTTRNATIANYSKNNGTTWTIANNTATITKATQQQLCYAPFYYGGTVTYTVTGATEANPVIFYETSINNPIASATSDGDITVIWGNNTNSKNIGIKTTGDLNITITIKNTVNTTINIPAINTQVNSYRGVQEPFGDIWVNIDGVIVNKASDGVNNLYVTDNIDFNDNVSNMTLIGTYNVEQNYVTDLNVGKHADFLIKTTDYNNSKFKDYHQDNNNDENRLFLVGGDAYSGSRAGLAVFYSLGGLGGAWANVSFRITTMFG